MSCEQEKFCSPRVRGLTAIRSFIERFGLLFPASTGINRIKSLMMARWASVPREYGD